MEPSLVTDLGLLFSKDAVEQRRNILELAPIATTSPDSEKATDLTTYQQQGNWLRVIGHTYTHGTYLFVFHMCQELSRWEDNAVVIFILTKVDLSLCL